MSRLCLNLAVTLSLTFLSHASAVSMTGSEGKKPQSVGLVLSGGGAKGIAEIGVIKALEENNIPIDYITGTSMGAIVGGLYACGYTPEEMMELILSPGFASWSTGKITPQQQYFFNHPYFTPEILDINLLSKSDSLRSILPSSLISPLPMNFAFMELFSGYTAQCGSDFNNLFVPFRCVTSDVYAKHKVVLSKGNLGDAIRASMSFPTVFQPIYVDGFLAFDGGLYDNFPVDVMIEDFKPDIILGVDVSSPNTRPPQYDLFAQLEDMIMQKSDYNVPPEAGIRIKIDTEGITLLQFPRAHEIYKRGYDKAMEMMDSIKTRVTARVDEKDVSKRRDEFKSRTPRIVFDKVKVTGGTPDQNSYIKYIFTDNKVDTFGIDKARDAYYRAVTTGRLRNLEPHAVYEGNGLFDLDLKATVRNNLHVGLGGYITTSVNSMLYLNAGYSSLSFNSVEANLSGWLGQSYMAAVVNARLFLPTSVPSALRLEGVVSRFRLHQSDNLFFEDREPVFITDMQAFTKASYSMAAGNSGMVDISAGYGYLRDNYSATGNGLLVGDGHHVIKNYLGAVGASATFYTLDNKMYPSSGHRYEMGVMGVTGYYTLTDNDNPGFYNRSKSKWLQLDVNATKFWDCGKWFSIGLEGTLMASTRKLLPDYNSSIVSAYAFNPTPSSYNAFHSSLRAMSYITAGITPVVKFTQNLQFRLTAHCFMPFRAIERGENNTAVYGRWFHDPKLFSEAAIAYNFPFASLAAYVNYIDSPGDRWNCGLSFGLYFMAPKFLRN